MLCIFLAIEKSCIIITGVICIFRRKYNSILKSIAFGSDKWDGPRSLKDMFPEDIDEEVLSKVDDYHLHLIVPAEIKDFSKFKTELGKAMKYIAVSEDTEAMEELTKDEAFKEIGIDTVYLINECTGSDIVVSEKEEVVDMCKGLEGYGKKQAFKMLVANVASLMETLDTNIEGACKALKITVQEYEEAKKWIE